jgi:hypothetical protein
VPGEWTSSFTILNFGTGWSGQIHGSTASPREKSQPVPTMQDVRDWVCFGAGLDIMGNRKICCPYRESNPDSSAVKEERKERKYGIKTTEGMEEQC